MFEPAPSDTFTSGSHHPPNNLFVGPHGLRPFWRLLIYLAILCVPVMLLVLASRLANEPVLPNRSVEHEISPLMAGMNEWLQLGFVFFATWIMSRIEDRDVFDYGLSRMPRLLRWVLFGASLGLVFQSLLIGILWRMHLLVFDGALLHGLSAVKYGLEWAIVFVGVGFFEEFLFRGYLQFNLTECLTGLVRYLSPRNRYAEAIGFWSAAVLISFGFGLTHGLNPGESGMGLLCAGCAGLMFAFSLWRTGSLWWAVGLHTAWDWAQSFLFGVADSGTISAHRLLTTHSVGPAWLSGGRTGPEGSIFVLPVMAALLIIAAVTLPRTRKSFVGDSTDAETPLVSEVNSAKG